MVARVAHGRAEEDLLVAVVQRRVDDLGDVEPLGQEADAAVDLAQALLAVEVVAVLGAVAVLGRPRHRLDDLRPLVVEQRHQLVAQALVAGGGDVVLRARRQHRRGDVVVVLVVVAIDLAGESLVHGVAVQGTPG